MSDSYQMKRKHQEVLVLKLNSERSELSWHSITVRDLRVNNVPITLLDF